VGINGIELDHPGFPARDNSDQAESQMMEQPASRIEDYAIIGDGHSAALVASAGSIDWLCLPRFDSGACFAALLGGAEHGYWKLAPIASPRRVMRRYRDATLVLETDIHTDDGVVRIVDCIPARSDHTSVVRVLVGIAGRVPMRMELVVRFDYGWVVPWMRRAGDHLHGVAGPDAICLATPVATSGENFSTVATFSVAAGERAAERGGEVRGTLAGNGDRLIAGRLPGGVEDGPVGGLHLGLVLDGDLGQDVAGAADGASLTQAVGEHELDGADQAGSAVGDHQQRRPQPSGDQAVQKALPGIGGLTRARVEADQHWAPVGGDAPCGEHRLGSGVVVHTEVRPVQEQVLE